MCLACVCYKFQQQILISKKSSEVLSSKSLLLSLTLARLSNSFCPASTHSFLPPQARNTEACKARP